MGCHCDVGHTWENHWRGLYAKDCLIAVEHYADALLRMFLPDIPFPSCFAFPLLAMAFSALEEA